MLVITYKSKNEKDIKFFLYNKKKNNDCYVYI